jgi:hypothetical protein
MGGIVMKDINTGGPAFPQGNDRVVAAVSIKQSQGMTLRQYAAIHLKLPNSGTDWLDEMIEEANKLDREVLTIHDQSKTL